MPLLRTLLWEGQPVEVNVHDDTGALPSFQSIKAELEEELSDGHPLEFRREVSAGKQARILASSWSAAMEDAHQVIVVSLKSTPSLPASPTSYMPQKHPWSAVTAAPEHLAAAPSVEQGEMSALQTLRRAKSYSPRSQDSTGQPSWQPFTTLDRPATDVPHPSHAHIPRHPHSPLDGLRRPSFELSSSHPSAELYSPPHTPGPSPRERDRSLSPSRHRAMGDDIYTPPESRRGSLIEDGAGAMKGLSHSRSGSGSLASAFAPTLLHHSGGSFFGRGRTYYDVGARKASEDLGGGSSVERENDSAEVSSLQNIGQPYGSLRSQTSSFIAFTRPQSCGSSTASEDSLATPAELDEAYSQHSSSAGQSRKGQTPSIPSLEMALMALQVEHPPRSYGASTKEEEQQRSSPPRRAKICANLRSTYARHNTPPPRPLGPSQPPSALPFNPACNDRPGTPTGLRTRTGVRGRPLFPPPPPPPTRSPTYSLGSTPSATTSRSTSRPRA